ncbi:MAG: recombinase family protein, partial [Erysipelotrichaceae bacterium]|nr:recombinase family protein [Erysipelotrichaceae bacterium]
MAVRQVRTIPATINRFSQQPTDGITKRKVAAYARVSTDSEEQQTSYTTQVNFYTQHIQSREDWEFVNVYTDEGISGTNTKHREGFNRMIKDALDGKIDVIITKSVSRFARNTVDSLSTIRKLKEHGVEVYFEKENIWTFDSKGELL